jgi:CheY-like chemotaxis protein
VIGRRILFYDPDPRVARTAERALLSTGSDVQSVTNPAELAQRLEHEKFDLLMMNFDPPTRTDPRWESVLESARKTTRVVLHATAQSEDYLPLFAERPFIRNLIAKNDEPLSPDELITTAEKLLRRDLFGLEKYLRWGIEPMRLTVRDSREKPDYVHTVATYARRLGCSERMLELVENIVDELVTNAIYNAPRDGLGTPRYAHMSRRDHVSLDPEEQGVLRFACDGDYIAISQEDPFGSLTQETIVTYLNRCLINPDGRTTEDGTWTSGGAGIGLFRVFQSLSKFVVNIDPGHRTEVIALLDLRLSMKRLRQSTKSFHIFVSDSAEAAAAGVGDSHAA